VDREDKERHVSERHAGDRRRQHRLEDQRGTQNVERQPRERRQVELQEPCEQVPRAGDQHDGNDDVDEEQLSLLVR